VLLANEQGKREQIIHAGTAPQRAHLELNLRRLPEQRPVDLIRTLDDLPGEHLGAGWFLRLLVLDDIPWRDTALPVA
jgi:hypothetical protein